MTRISRQIDVLCNYQFPFCTKSPVKKARHILTYNDIYWLATCSQPFPQDHFMSASWIHMFFRWSRTFVFERQPDIEICLLLLAGGGILAFRGKEKEMWHRLYVPSPKIRLCEKEKHNQGCHIQRFYCSTMCSWFICFLDDSISYLGNCVQPKGI